MSPGLLDFSHRGYDSVTPLWGLIPYISMLLGYGLFRITVLGLHSYSRHDLPGTDAILVEVIAVGLLTA